MSIPWTKDAPCENCGRRARDHDNVGHAQGCIGYLPVVCQGTDDNHGGPVRVREDDSELCTSHWNRKTHPSGTSSIGNYKVHSFEPSSEGDHCSECGCGPGATHHTR